ncbi:hypothetical protein C8R46DRAFT_1311320 [Mycena filopes]|nr:hypothetical protein C8R46DRAFT_1311320 [Mycena filopes]
MARPSTICSGLGAARTWQRERGRDSCLSKYLLAPQPTESTRSGPDRVYSMYAQTGCGRRHDDGSSSSSLIGSPRQTTTCKCGCDTLMIERIFSSSKYAGRHSALVFRRHDEWGYARIRICRPHLKVFGGTTVRRRRPRLRPQSFTRPCPGASLQRCGGGWMMQFPPLSTLTLEWLATVRCDRILVRGRQHYIRRQYDARLDSSPTACSRRIEGVVASTELSRRGCAQAGRVAATGKPSACAAGLSTSTPVPRASSESGRAL